MLKKKRELLFLGTIIWVLASTNFLSNVQAQLGPQNWAGPENNYPLNWNYNPQNTINASNVQSLQIDWTFPIPEAPPQYAGAEGAMITPLLINGIIYTVTNWHRVFAINAKNGAVVWFQDLPLNQNYSLYLQPSVPAGLGYNTGAIGHYHAMLYTTEIRNEPLLWIVSNTYQVFALSALTGDVVINFQPFPANLSSIHGNFGLYDQDTPMILLDQQRGILIFGPSVSEGTSDGRGFIEAFNMSTTSPSLLWQSFVMPPQDGSDPRWSVSSVQNMSHAYIFNGSAAVDLKALSPFVLNSTLYGDWGTLGYNGTRSYAGMSAGWGGAWALDENRGVAFIGTSQASPDWNATNRPGPNLWSDSVLSINTTTGKPVWGFQVEAHALGDFDCSWNVLLANATIHGQNTEVVYKGCKNGYLFALNAADGSMIWYLKPPSIRWDNVTILNPTNKTQMTNYNWEGSPGNTLIVLNPADTGSLESDIAFNPALNLLYLAPYNAPKLFRITDVGPGVSSVFNYEFDWGTDFSTLSPAGPENTTVYAVNASTGAIVWSYFIANQPYRGGLSVSGGVVYVSTLDGVLRMLDAQNGKLISQKTIGGELLTQPAIAQDSSGTMKVVLTDTGSARWGPTFPGFLEALTLGNSTGGLQTSVITQTLQTTITSQNGISQSLLYVSTTLAAVFIIATVILFAERKSTQKQSQHS